MPPLGHANAIGEALSGTQAALLGPGAAVLGALIALSGAWVVNKQRIDADRALSREKQLWNEQSQVYQQVVPHMLAIEVLSQKFLTTKALPSSMAPPGVGQEWTANDTTALARRIQALEALRAQMQLTAPAEVLERFSQWMDNVHTLQFYARDETGRRDSTDSGVKVSAGSRELTRLMRSALR